MSEIHKQKKLSKLEKAQKEAQENLQGWQRAKADYANLQKELDARLQDAKQYANAQLILELLPIYNNFEQALEHMPQDEKNKEWAKGVVYIHKQFEEVLTKLGLERIDTLGQKFNPELHEAVTHEKQSDVESEHIYEEVQAGYSFNNKTLIAAKVKVAK